MASKQKLKCDLCNKEVVRLVRHMETVHRNTINPSQLENFKLGKRKLRADSKSKISSRSYVKCTFMNEGKQCGSYILKNGYNKHLHKMHGIKARSKVGQKVATESKRTKIDIQFDNAEAQTDEIIAEDVEGQSILLNECSNGYEVPQEENDNLPIEAEEPLIDSIGRKAELDLDETLFGNSAAGDSIEHEDSVCRNFIPKLPGEDIVEEIIRSTTFQRDFKKWMCGEKKTKVTVANMYTSTVASMVKEGLSLINPERFLEEVLKNQTKSTFRKKYWGLYYYYEYKALNNEEKIHELKTIEMYFEGEQKRKQTNNK